MNTKRNKNQVFETEFPLLRAKLLELAAGLDRIDRAIGSQENEDRLAVIREALNTILRPGPDRAEQIQLLFSRAYSDHWRTEMEL